MVNSKWRETEYQAPTREQTGNAGFNGTGSIMRSNHLLFTIHYLLAFVFGGGPKSPYAMNPERVESSFWAMRPIQISLLASFAVLTTESFSLPLVVIVISP